MDIIDKVLSLLISAAIIALGNWIAVGTVTKHSSFVWTLLALFPLLTGFISFYHSLKVTPDKLSPAPVLPALSGPGLHIEHRTRNPEGRMTVLIYVDTSKQVGDRDHLNFNQTYGSLGAVIGFMTWLWISAIVVLAGGEINAEMEHQTVRDTTTGSPKPMGTRGAYVADTVGPAQSNP
jgi:Virulence factor BrkB